MLLLAGLLLAGGCTYLADAKGGAISLRTYDCVLVESVEVAPEVADEWLASELKDTLQARLAVGGDWETPGLRADARTLRLHVAIASATVSACGAGLGTCKGCSVACRVTARDAGSGKPLGSADLAATCGRPKGWFAQGGDLPIGVDEPDRCRRSVVANLAGQIVKTLRTAKQCSRQWESGIMGCGC